MQHYFEAMTEIVGTSQMYLSAFTINRYHQIHANVIFLFLLNDQFYMFIQTIRTLLT